MLLCFPMIGGEQCLKSVSEEVPIGYLENIFTGKMVQHRENFPREMIYGPVPTCQCFRRIWTMFLAYEC